MHDPNIVAADRQHAADDAQTAAADTYRQSPTFYNDAAEWLQHEADPDTLTRAELLRFVAWLTTVNNPAEVFDALRGLDVPTPTGPTRYPLGAAYERSTAFATVVDDLVDGNLTVDELGAA